MKKYLFMVLAVLFFAGLVAAHDHDQNQYYDNHSGYDSSYRDAYTQGYNHGAGDAQAREDFDFRHDEAYQNGSDNFRRAYAEGYADGYYGRRPAIDMGHGGSDRDYDRGGYDRDYDRDGGSYRGSGSSGYGRVAVFTDRGFRGMAQSFGPGQYRYLYGNLNDNIDSIRIEGNVRVILFDLSDFRGERIVLDRDAWDLGHFRNKAASMIIEPMSYGNGYGGYRPWQ
jgi:hypothetical protein